MRWKLIGATCGATIGLGLGIWCYVLDPPSYKIELLLDADSILFLAIVLGIWSSIGAVLGLLVGVTISALGTFVDMREPGEDA
jgi:hypothetical protein